MKPDERRLEIAIAALLILAGAALRAHGIADHALWIDEYGTAWAVAGEGWGELWHRVLAVHGQSPLYYAVVRASTGIFGADALGLRLPSLVCGVGLLALARPLAHAAFHDDRAALATLAALTVNERLVYYSQEARPYAMALLLAGLSFWSFARLWEDPRRRSRQLAYALATAATFYTHYLFGVVIAVQLLYLLWRGPRTLPAWRPWLVVFGVLGLACAPALGQLLALLGRREDLDWVGRGGPSALEVLAGFVDPPVLLLAVVAVAACALVARGVRRPPPEAHIGLVVLWLSLPFASIALVSTALDVNLVHPRYLLPSLPAAALLYGGLLALPRQRGALGWLPLAIFVVGVALLRLAPPYQQEGLFSQRRTLERWEQASRALLAVHQPGDPILYQTKFVELDAVVRGEASPELTEFTTWPVAAHLPRDRRASLRALPAGEDPGMQRALRQRLEDAARHRQSFVVLTSSSLGRVLGALRRQPGLAIVSHKRFGYVHLLRLRGHEG